jgi:hypothetical protein
MRYDWGKIRILYVTESARNCEESSVSLERSKLESLSQSNECLFDAAYLVFSYKVPSWS